MDACSLHNRHCTPCQGGLPALTAAEASARRAELASDWTLDEAATQISRRFKCPNFREALALANRIGELAEAEGHHPTLTVGWGFCRVELTTHKIKGLHDNDFLMAAKIDVIVRS